MEEKARQLNKRQAHGDRIQGGAARPSRAFKHPKMQRLQRAKQFMPFAALVGFETLLEEERARHCAQYETIGENL